MKMPAVAYCPSVEEIYSRGEGLRWMEKMGWPEFLIDSVMMLDCPDLATVRRLVYKRGPEEAKAIILSFVEWENNVAIDPEKYLRLKKVADKARTDADRAEGVLGELRKRLKSEFDVDTIEEADVLLKQLTGQERDVEDKYSVELAAFESKWGKLV